MSKVLLQFDARADAADKEIKKLQAQMAKMADAPKKANKEMGSFGKEAKNLIGTFGGIVSAGAVVTAMISKWRQELELSIQSAKTLGGTLKSAMAGIGLAGETLKVRNWVRSKQAAGQLTLGDEDVASVVRTFTGSYAASSSDELIQMLGHANRLHAEFGLDTGAVSQMTGMAGSIMMGAEGKIGTEEAMLAAYTLSTGLGNTAPQAAIAFRRRAREVGGESAMSELPELMAIAAAGERGTSIQQLQQQYERLGGEHQYGSFSNFVQTVNESSLPEASRRSLHQIRRGLPAARRSVADASAAWPDIGRPVDEIDVNLIQGAKESARGIASLDIEAGSAFDRDRKIAEAYKLGLSGFDYWQKLLPTDYLAYRLGEDRKRSQMGFFGYYLDMFGFGGSPTPVVLDAPHKNTTQGTGTQQ